MSSQLYDEAFYDSQEKGSFESAMKMVKVVGEILDVKSVVDLGCGRGTWLKAFKTIGAKELVGIDGFWNSSEKLMDSSIIFEARDLEKNINLGGKRFDVAMSVEVAEHLNKDVASQFVKNICQLSDVVLFGAAIPHQGGVDHINEQPQSYWAKKFLDEGFEVYDLFRPSLWGDGDIESFYRQNTFLYVRKQSGAYELVRKAGEKPLASISFMDVVHPDLLDVWVSRVNISHILLTIVKNNTPLFFKKLIKKLIKN